MHDHVHQEVEEDEGRQDVDKSGGFQLRFFEPRGEINGRYWKKVPSGGEVFLGTQTHSAHTWNHALSRGRGGRAVFLKGADIGCQPR